MLLVLIGEGNDAGARQAVGAFNGSIGLPGPVALQIGSGRVATGSYCLRGTPVATNAKPSAPQRDFFATATGALPLSVVNVKLPQSIKGIEFPRAPGLNRKVRVECEASLLSGLSRTPVADLIYIGDDFGNILSNPVNRFRGREQITAVPLLRVGRPGARVCFGRLSASLGHFNWIFRKRYRPIQTGRETGSRLGTRVDACRVYRKGE